MECVCVCCTTTAVILMPSLHAFMPAPPPLCPSLSIPPLPAYPPSTHLPAYPKPWAHIPSTLCLCAHRLSTLCFCAHIPSTLCICAHRPSTLCFCAHRPSTLCFCAPGPAYPIPWAPVPTYPQPCAPGPAGLLPLHVCQDRGSPHLRGRPRGGGLVHRPAGRGQGGSGHEPKHPQPCGYQSVLQ